MGSTIRISIVGNAANAVRALRNTGSAATKAGRKLKALGRDASKSGALVKLFGSRADRTSRSLKHLSSGTSVFGIVAKVAASKLALFGGAVVGALPTLLRFGSALAPLAGLLVALPAVVVSAASVFGALKIATQGVGEAMSAGLSGDTVAFADAMHKIPPAARQFVTSVVALRKPIDALRARVSTAFFTPFMKDVQPLAAKLLPLLSRGLSRIARALGYLVHDFMVAARASGFLKGLAGVFDATTTALGKLRPVIPKIVAAFGDLLKGGVSIVVLLATKVGVLVTRFADWIRVAAKTGKLKAWLAGGLKAFGHLWRIVGNVIGIFKSLFRSTKKGSGGMLASLEALTEQLDRFLNSDAGQRKLRNFFDKVDQITTTIYVLFVALLPVIGLAASALATIATYLATHETTTRRLGIAIVAVWSAWKLVTIGIATARAAMVVFNLVSAANPIGLVILAVAALAGAIAYLAIKTNFFQDAWKSIKMFFADLPKVFPEIGRRIIQGLKDGMTSMFPDIKASLRSLTSGMASWKGPESVDKTLLRGPGQIIMGGLIAGIESQVPLLRRTLGAVSTTIAGGLSASPTVALRPTVAVGAVAAARASGATVAPVAITVNVPPATNLADAGRAFEAALRAHERRTGRRVLAAAL